MERRIAVRGIIVSNGQLLCVRHKHSRTIQDPAVWCTPGGGLEDGESLLQALDRELTEELGVTPRIGKLLYVQQYRFGEQKEKEELEFFFLIDNPQDFVNINLASTTHGNDEIKDVAFIDPTQHKILPTFLTQESFDTENTDTKFFSYN